MPRLIVAQGAEVDAENLLQNIFPRSAAVAERLHTPLARIGDATEDPESPQISLESEVTQRLERFRCALVRRGIAAGPVAWPSYCRGAPSLTMADAEESW